MKNHRKQKEAPSFHVLVEAADHLTLGEQEVLLEVLSHRLADRRRAELVADVQAARREFRKGNVRPATPDEIMKEILS